MPLEYADLVALHCSEPKDIVDGKAKEKQREYLIVVLNKEKAVPVQLLRDLGTRQKEGEQNQS